MTSFLRGPQVCKISYYIVDIEMLFTTDPFVSAASGRNDLSFVTPNFVQSVSGRVKTGCNCTGFVVLCPGYAKSSSL